MGRAEKLGAMKGAGGAGGRTGTPRGELKLLASNAKGFLVALGGGGRQQQGGPGSTAAVDKGACSAVPPYCAIRS